MFIIKIRIIVDSIKESLFKNEIFLKVNFYFTSLSVKANKL
jgi:hypothetical protein